MDAACPPSDGWVTFGQPPRPLRTMNMLGPPDRLEASHRPADQEGTLDVGQLVVCGVIYAASMNWSNHLLGGVQCWPCQVTADDPFELELKVEAL
jgi:hypothetical protein